MISSTSRSTSTIRHGLVAQFRRSFTKCLRGLFARLEVAHILPIAGGILFEKAASPLSYGQNNFRGNLGFVSPLGENIGGLASLDERAIANVACSSKWVVRRESSSNQEGMLDR